MPCAMVPLRLEHFFFCEVLIEMLLLLHTDLETTLLVCLRSVTTGGSRGTQVKKYCSCATRDPPAGHGFL